MKIPEELLPKLAPLFHDGLEKKMVLHMMNAMRPERFQFVEKAGRKALGIELAYENEGGDKDWRRFGRPGFAQRVQIKLSDIFSIRKGNESWYKLSYFLEGNNLTPNVGNRNKVHELALLDLKLQGRDYQDIGVALSYGIGRDRYAIRYISNKNGRKVLYVGAPQYEFPENFFFLDQQKPANRWVDIVLNINWSQDGHTCVWVDEKLILNADYAPLGGPNTNQYSFKFGPYRQSHAIWQESP